MRLDDLLWRPIWRHPVGRYAAALVLTLLAAGLRQLAEPLVAESVPFIFFYVALIVAGLFGGLGPGLLSLALSAVLSTNLVPIGTLEPGRTPDLVALAFYFLVCGAILAVTESARRARSRAETELERRQRLLDQLQAGLVVLDAHWRCVFFNAEGARILGLTERELLGRDVREVFHAPPAALESLERARKGEIVEFERLYAPWGRWFLVRAFPCPEGVGVFFLDITERKRDRQRADLLAAIVSSSEDAVVSKDLEGRISSWNQAAERMFGYTEAEAVGQSIALILPEDRPDDFRQILEQIRRGKPVEHYETRRRRKDGVILDVSLTVSPIRDESGAIVGASKIARDITAAKAAEAELRRTRDLFLGMLGHDLRNPLNAIVSSLYTLERQAGDTARPAFARISRAADRMSRMISQLLDFTRTRLGAEIPLKPVAGDLARILAAAVEEQETVHPNRVFLSVSGSLPGLWDPDRLGQVVSNLVVNAIQHGASDSPVSVTASAVDGMVILDVCNRGKAIPAGALGTLFEPFARARGGTTPGGVGLGLYIVRQIVLAHGGTIDVDSNDERTRFRVCLPSLRSLQESAPGGRTGERLARMRARPLA